MEEALNHYRERMGWNDQSIIFILCEYIKNQQDDSAFEDFICRIAEEEGLEESGDE